MSSLTVCHLPKFCLVPIFYFWEIWNLIKNYPPFLLSYSPMPPPRHPLSTSWLFSDNPISPVSAVHICMSVEPCTEHVEPTRCYVISTEWFSIPSSKYPLPTVPQCGLRPRDHRPHLYQNVGSLDLGTVLCRWPKLLWVYDCHSHFMSRRQHSTAPLHVLHTLHSSHTLFISIVWALEELDII